MSTKMHVYSRFKIVSIVTTNLLEKKLNSMNKNVIKKYNVSIV